ncbi:hypothetical protein BC834DRAFT_376215 [Gloeopeniophorella convolvens]|nr:hypothetical protein BC834DRAFT_376215 [Gloeopeniophorella convolvens]
MSQHAEGISSPASSTDTISDAHGLNHVASKDLSTPRDVSAQPQWASQLSASFSAIADQLQLASRALSHASLVPPSPSPSTLGVASDLATLAARLDTIEQTQDSLAIELARLRALQAGKGPANEITVEGLGASDGQTASPSGVTVEDLDKRIADALAVMKLDQDRLYARLHNSRVTVSKMPIMVLPTATGKPPPNYPSTKGEFEHLTKERYEALLKAYGQPVLKGDTAAKREALRVFIGLPA